MLDTSPPTPQSQYSWHATIADWLAGLFIAPVSVATVESYRDGVGAAFLWELDQEPGCRSGARRMRISLSDEAPASTVAHRLGIAFAHLFEGVGGPGGVALFESVHVSPSGLLFQAQEAAMGARLRRADLFVSDGPGAPADHLSVELALLAKLTRCGATRDELAALLDNHLLSWTPGFANQVAAADVTGFYAGAVLVLSGFLTAQRTAIAADRDAWWQANESRSGMIECPTE
jgi:TorA-specific chaperone